MILLEVRRKFIEMSGRDDFATTENSLNDTDAGADFFIQGGTVDLDLEQDSLMSEANHIINFAVDDYKMELDYCRNITDVYFTDSDGEKDKLLKRSHDELIKLYPEEGRTTSGTPVYWAQYTLRRSPSQITAGKEVDIIGIMILPPTDEAVRITVNGKWYSTRLETNDQDNFWSINFPNILILASLRHMEGFYRNTQGWKDYDFMIAKALQGIDKDLVEWDAAGEIVMEG